MALGPRALGTGLVMWAGRRVLVTGHTGFKGGWLCTWLAARGAKVTGLALPPETSPSFLERAPLALDEHLVDLRDAGAVAEVVDATDPEVVFHLAAQSLVRRSYREPVGTFATNVMGTVHLLEALRRIPSLRAVVVATTDKCYENRGWEWPYREDDALGGHDPYSASKAATELAVASYRRSFLAGRVATARAGNVIGGGDWAEDRLVPDAMRAFAAGDALRLRNPGHTRPWQHVLDPLAGYLRLAEALWAGADVASAWNFGPDEDGFTTAEIADRLAAGWGDGARVLAAEDDGPHEHGVLRLDASRARHKLGWRPRLGFAAAVGWTVAWYRAAQDPARDMSAFTREQIAQFEAT